MHTHTHTYSRRAGLLFIEESIPTPLFMYSPKVAALSKTKKKWIDNSDTVELHTQASAHTHTQ